ncbi:uncharacterized protein BDV14DRAFT_195055 [Aspergillus stella-maris]|uniref:uncharacterized protein n=1 Tax=Aspergillus stella-maris TaxID=1810926 RepID=UPI003CCE241F
MSHPDDSPEQDASVDSRVLADVDDAERRGDHARVTPEECETLVIQHATQIPLSGHSSAPNHTTLRYPSFNRNDIRRNSNLPTGNGTNGSPDSQSSLVDEKDPLSSRIPRVAALKQAAIASAAKGNRAGSSIPIAIKRHSAEGLGTNTQVRQSEPSPNGIRLVEKPRGPRPRPHTEQAAFTIPESSQRTEKATESTPPSASRSSVSSWDFREDDEPEKPATVFTGEYRTRILGIPGHHSPRPTLRIASSAENLIMGETSSELPSNTDTNKASPSLRQRLSRLAPGTPKGSNSPKTAPASKGILGSTASTSDSQNDSPTSRNFCRPKTSLEAIAKRDISAKEMSISRKSVSSRPSIHSLFSPSPKALGSDEEPNVPKIPDQYSSKSVRRLSAVILAAPATSATFASQSKDGPSASASEVSQIPRTAIKVGPMNLHPPRTSSLQALSELANGPGSEGSSAAVPGGERSSGTKGLKRNVTFNNLTPPAWDNDQFNVSPDKFRLPESRGNHLLGSFRNIFRSRSGASDKDRVKAAENSAPAASNGIQAPNGDKATAKEQHIANDCDRSTKPKSKHTRISSGVSWNRSRNPKAVTESPGTSTPCEPRLLAPPHRLPDGNIPSFARPTRSTRTEASPSLKGPTSLTRDTNTRRSQVRTASTGSPQRLTRGSRRNTGSILVLHSQQEETQSSDSHSEKRAAAKDEPIDNIPKNLDIFHGCLETLCKKIGEAPTSLERDRHIRLALRLQQQLGDYQSIEKTALEAKSLAKEKLLEKTAAEESLNTSLEEAQAQLKDD